MLSKRAIGLCAALPFAVAWANAATVTIDTVGSQADWFVTSTSASVVVLGPSDAYLHNSSFKLNGQDVSGAFQPSGAGAVSATLTGLQSGPNVVEVFNAQDGQPQPVARQTITRSIPVAATCASLAGLTIPASAIGLPTSGVTITSATVIPAIPQSVSGSTVTLATPQFCRVLGAIRPVDPTAPNINFQVNIPDQWNQKIAQLGGSGNNGSIPGALVGNGMRFGPESIPPDSPYLVTRGYVMYGSDSGHQGGNTWPLNQESFVNYGYAQLKKTHDVALALTVAAYGVQPRKSYFFGSSTGGREALQVAQRYPLDYDGIFSQVPVVSWAEVGTYLPIRLQRAQLADGWIPPAKIPAINQEVRRQCDGTDGVVDGLISNYLNCNKLFDPTFTPNPFQNIRCPGGADTGNTCLSDAQLAVVDLWHAPTVYPYPTANGWTTYAGWGVGSEIQGNGPQSNTKPNLTATNAPSPLLVATVGTTSFNSLTFRPEDYPAGVQYVMSVINATNPDLSQFASHGGKLLLKSNTSDYTAGARIPIQYYESVVAAMGRSTVDQFMRHYNLVGAWHNRNVGTNTVTGATVPYYVDFIALVDNWVEDGNIPPDNITATFQDGIPPFTVRSSQPMCRYPQYPYYLGSGDPTNAINFRCVYSGPYPPKTSYPFGVTPWK